MHGNHWASRELPNKTFNPINHLIGSLVAAAKLVHRESILPNTALEPTVTRRCTVPRARRQYAPASLGQLRRAAAQRER